MQPLDYSIVAAFFAISLAVGVAVARRAGQNAETFFLSGRNMPWWLLGVSMVATTFSADTPNLVTDIVRQNGVAGNWVWWAFLLTGMLTVFVYARLWRRSGVLTDLEFYEIRYSGKPAAFLRGFRALYLGVFFNVLIMASVILAMIKIAAVLLNLSPVTTVIIASAVTVAYSAAGGLTGVLITDLVQFAIAMVGAIAAAVVAVNLPEVGGLSGLLQHDAVRPKLAFVPAFTDRDAWLTLIILPIAVQWWSVWYPGSEPGGGGYVAQRMLSARTEQGAAGATLFFNAAHYAIRPWPWIIVALCSLIVFPDLDSLAARFPQVDASVLGHDLAYPAMLGFLPTGLLGIAVASLIAAFMSTISTHLNWGSSYIVNDFYKRFINPGADSGRQVAVGRLSTVVLMVLGASVGLLLQNALQAFNILLQVGAGTGLLFILRWFWWRINPWSEITAMVVSFVVALFFQVIQPALGMGTLPSSVQLVSGVAITTVAWLLVTLVTPPSDDTALFDFYRLVRPGGPGWKRVVDRASTEGVRLEVEGAAWNVPLEIGCMLTGTVTIYSALLATGSVLYGRLLTAALIAAVGIASGAVTWRLWRKAQRADRAGAQLLG